MKQAYTIINFRADSMALIDTMNGIIDEYQNEGYVLTVRQLYYQLVARDIVENTEQSYKRITGLVNDARMAGIMDWAAIEDRTREFIKRAHWDSPGSIVRACASQYHEDMWDSQETRVFVIVEKEALAGVLERVCHEFDVPLLAARGYPSVSVLREFAVDVLEPHMENGQRCHILHLGDHDPSGIDMTRDLDDRLQMFCGYTPKLVVERIALNMSQVEEQRPPENPAKATDSRFREYREKYGEHSWELDALTPQYLNALVERNVVNFIDETKWQDKVLEIGRHRKLLSKAATAMETGKFK